MMCMSVSSTIYEETQPLPPRFVSGCCRERRRFYGPCGALAFLHVHPPRWKGNKDWRVHMGGKKGGWRGHQKILGRVGWKGQSGTPGFLGGG